MLRFHTAVTSALAAALVVPVFLGQGQVASLNDALTGTRRALEVLKGLEKRLHDDPAGALGLVLSATEAPSGDETERERHLEDLRNEVNLLQMEYDALQSPMLASDGAVQSALGASVPGEPPRPAQPLQITTGFDDSVRALLNSDPSARPARGETREPAPKGEARSAEPAETAYSADPLRHGITCYRAGRYAEAYELLVPLEDANALYWQARTLERLERLDEAVKVMERALAKGGEGFEARRAQTDLEFLRWKRDFVKSLPQSGAKPELAPASAGKTTPAPKTTPPSPKKQEAPK